MSAVNEFERNEQRFDSLAISNDAALYDRTIFEQKFSDFVTQKAELFFNQ